MFEKQNSTIIIVADTKTQNLGFLHFLPQNRLKPRPKGL